jgi:FixJ family two-component response regulator
VIQPLTPREAQVLAALSAGRTQKEIAADLAVSVVYVQHVTFHARLKMGATTTAQAIAIFSRGRKTRA